MKLCSATVLKPHLSVSGKNALLKYLSLCQTTLMIHFRFSYNVSLLSSYKHIYFKAPDLEAPLV